MGLSGVWCVGFWVPQGVGFGYGRSDVWIKVWIEFWEVGLVVGKGWGVRVVDGFLLGKLICNWCILMQMMIFESVSKKTTHTGNPGNPDIMPFLAPPQITSKN